VLEGDDRTIMAVYMPARTDTYRGCKLWSALLAKDISTARQSPTPFIQNYAIESGPKLTRQPVLSRTGIKFSRKLKTLFFVVEILVNFIRI
jgi:hypothetical protein